MQTALRALSSAFILTIILASGVSAKTSVSIRTTALPRSVPDFHLDAWRGMGNLALFAASGDAARAGASEQGNTLYTLVNSSVGGRDTVSAHLIAKQTYSASFSPDGRWLVAGLSAGDGLSTLFVSADGRDRTLLPDVRTGAWQPGTDDYIYSTGVALWRIGPRGGPRQLSLPLPRDAEVDSITFSPKRDEAALDLTFAPHGQTERFDRMVLWDPATGALRTLFRTKAPAGVWVQGFSRDGRSLYYWPNPAHALSAMLDGASLREFAIATGRSRPVTETATWSDAVTPLDGNRAALLTDIGRYPYEPGRIAIWDGRAPRRIPAAVTGDVHSAPAFSPILDMLAFTVGPSPTYVTDGPRIQRWYATVPRLATCDLRTGRLRVLTQVGGGVSGPVYFSANGRRIVYSRQGQTFWIDARGNGLPHEVVQDAGIAAYAPAKSIMRHT